MSARNRLEAKRARRAYRKNFKNPLPAKIDLIQWIKLRSNVTTSDAVRLILGGALKVDSHTIGYTTINDAKGEHKILNRYVPASHRGQIRLVSPGG